MSTHDTPHTPSAAPTWTIEDIAAYYRRSLRQTRRIVASTGFPPPLLGDDRRWSAAKVRAWAEGVADDSKVLRASVPRGARIVRRRAAA